MVVETPPNPRRGSQSSGVKECWSLKIGNISSVRVTLVVNTVDLRFTKSSPSIEDVEYLFTFIPRFQESPWLLLEALAISRLCSFGAKKIEDIK